MLLVDRECAAELSVAFASSEIAVAGTGREVFEDDPVRRAAVEGGRVEDAVVIALFD